MSERKLSMTELKSLLNFDSDAPYKLAEILLGKVYELRDEEVVLSRTGDNEILIYREVDGCFYNILIDEDADLSFMYIGNIRSESYTYITDDTSTDNIARVVKDFSYNRQ